MGQQARGKILLIDDDAAMQRIFCKMLERGGYVVETAVNGLEGVDQWRKSDFDLILMDIRMPVMDGCTAALNIRKEERKLNRRHVPIVVVTAAQEDDFFYENCDVDEVLFKPIRMKDLLRHLETHLPSPPAQPPH